MTTKRTRKSILPARLVGFLFLAFGAFLVSGQSMEKLKLSSASLDQIRILQDEKASRTPALRKLDSQLIYSFRQKRLGIVAPGMKTFKPAVSMEADGRLLVDINATVGENLLDFIKSNGGLVVNSFSKYRAVRALVPVDSLEALAARSDIRSIRPADQAVAHNTVGALPTQGDIAHRANLARQTYSVNGSGVQIAVLSDSVDYLSSLQAAGDLPSVTVLPGQGGVGNGEGTAMLEIVHTVAPGANLYFASAFNGVASFAQNIRDLHAAGCQIIVDDVSYFSESPFQDGPIAQAVSDVCAGGALYFSSAGNWGNKDKGTSSIWEGDFKDVGQSTLGRGGRVHDFGGSIYNTILPGGSLHRIDLYWADPLGASTNDYDVYVLDSNGAVVASSSNVQDGQEDPYESVPSVSPGQRVMIVKYSGEDRYLSLTTGRGILQYSTPGSVRGHNASGATNAFSIAATRVSSPPVPFSGGATNPVETFSADGPRRMFFDFAGNAFTPGNFSSTGGLVLHKPDLTAADGVTTTVPTFSIFLGTSAAAPHAAAIAALLQSYDPSLTPADIRSILSVSALDIEGPGSDRDSGAGILAALDAIASLRIKLALAGYQLLDANANGVLDRNECANLLITLTNQPAPTRRTATGITAVLTSSTPGVLVDPTPQSFADLPPDGVTASTATFRISTSPQYQGGSPVTFLLQGTTSNQVSFSLTFQLTPAESGLGAPVDFTSSQVTPIPDFGTTSSGIAVSGFPLPVANVRVGVYITHTYDSDLRFSLVGPDGTEVLLSANNGLDGQNYGAGCSNLTIFSQDAPLSISSGVAPFLGAYAPQGLLTTFTGKSGAAVNGTWNLVVEDQVVLDTGTIQCWSLELTPLTSADAGNPCLAAAQIANGPTDQIVTVGSNVSLTVLANGTDPLTYQWYFDQTNLLQSATNATLVLTNIGLSQGGAYNVVVQNLYGQQTSAPAVITVTVPPSISIAPLDQIVPVGQDATFIVSAGGTAPLSYQWWYNGSNSVAGGTNATLVLSNVVPGQAGGYEVVVSNLAGALTSRVATLTVRVPLVLECGSNYPVQLGAPWGFVAPTASGNNVSVVVVGTVTNQGLCGSYTATRTWQASDQFNDQLQCSQTVSVVAGAGPVVQCGTNKTVVAGSSLLFDTPMLSEPGVVAAAVYDNLGTDTGVRVNAGQVETGQQVVLGGTNRYVSGFEVGYWGTNASGPQFAGNVQAEVRFYRNDGPVLTGGEVSPGTVIYDSGPIGVGATNSGVLGIVDFVNGAAVPLSGVLPDTFTWTVQFSGLGAGDGAGLEVYGPVAVGVGGTNYWEKGSGNWVASSNGGDLGVKVAAMNRPLNLVVVGTVTNQVAGVDYAVTRSWLGSDTCGNSVGCNQRISVVSGPGLVSQPVDEVVTNGGVAQFGVVGSGTAPLSYQWWYNGSNSVAGGTNATLVLSNVTPGQAGGYEVVVSNLVGTITSQVANLTVRLPLVLECGSNYTVQVGTAWGFVAPTASGNNVGVVVVGTVTNQGLCGSYTAIRTWLATDQFTNQATCSQTVSVGTPAPVVQCVGSKTVMAGASFVFDTPVVSETGIVAAVVYDNLGEGTDKGVRFNAGQVETGQQVVLGGTNRYASGFEVGYWGTNASGPQFTGNVQAEVKFYLNNGILSGLGESSPKTVIYDSGPIGVGATNSGVLEIVDFVTGAVVPLSGLLPDTFTWTVQFSGLGAGDGAGLEVYGPVGVGVGGTNYWQRNGSRWQESRNGSSFGATVAAVNRPLNLVVVGTVTNQVVGVDYAVTRSWLASDACGNSAGCSQAIGVISRPGLVSQPVDEVVTNGGVAQFGVVASGTAPLSYQWWYNGSNSVAGGTNAMLVLSNVTSKQVGQYDVVVSNLVGAITSQVATLTVRVPLVLECGSNYTVQLGAPWDFVVPTASGNNVSVVVVGTVTNQGLCGSYTATRTWQASDQFNDQLQCSQTVTVLGGSGPIGAASGPVMQCGDDKTVVAGSSLLFDTPMLSEPGVVAAAVYDNLGTDTGVRVNAGQVETGQQVVLGGTNRYVSGFEAGYWGTNASGPQFAGNVQAEVRFYRNDGPVLTGGEVSPGTVIYDSGPIGVGATNSGVLGIVDFVNGAVVPLSGVLPDTFTWTVQFSGLGAGDGAGLEVYGPVAVGVGGTNYWENVSGGWEALSNGGDLGVRVEAMSRGLSVVVVGTVTNQVTGVDYAVTRSWLGSDTCGNSAGCNQTISVISGPGLVSQPVDEVVTNGGVAQFGVVASGTAPLSYQWWYDGSNSVAGGTNATLVLSNVTPGQAGGYEVVVSNLVGAITSQVATLTVRVPLVLECGSNFTVQLGTAWDFTPPIASGNNVSDVVAGTVTNQGLCGGYSATRTWVATDQSSNQLACSQTVTVVAGSGPVVQCGNSKTVVAGGSLLFDTPMLSEPGVVAAAVYDNLGTDTGVRVNAGQVETGQQVVLGGTNRYVSGFEAGYWGTNASGPQFAGNVQAEVRFYRNDGPVLTGGEVSPGTVIYDSGPIGVGATNSGVLGIVDFVNGAVVPLSGVLPDTFTWTVQFSGLGAGDGAGLEVYGPVAVGVGGTNYWENVSGGWEALSNGGDLGVRVEAMSRGLSVVVVGTVTNQVTGVDYAVTRSWLGSDTCGNSAGCSQRISVISGPGLVSQPVDEVVTNGGATQFGVVASGTAPLSYQWWYNGSNSVAGGTNATLVLSNVTPGQAGGYEVVVSNLVGAITSQVATLTVRVPLLLECGSNYTVQLGTAWDFVGPTASGNNVSVVVVGTATNQGLCGSYTATRTWQASDQFNDQLQCSQTVGVVAGSTPVVQCGTNKTVVAGGSLVFDAPVVSETGILSVVVYNNLGADTGVRLNAGQVETGQRVALAGTNRYASRFEVGYWGTNANGPQFTGNVRAEVRFYLNDGVLSVLGEANPSTVIYDSGPIGVGATNSGILEIVDFVSGAVVPLSGLLPDTFTWTVQFSGLGAGDGAGLEVYGPVGVGVGGTNYWQRSGGRWQELANESSFGATVAAVNRPLSLVVVGTVTNQVVGVDYAVTRSWLASDACGNSAGCSQTIGVISGPGLVSQPVDEVVTNGGVAQFGVVASGTAPLSYQWWFSGSNSVPGGTNATLVLSNVTPGQAGGYEVVVSNLVGAITSQVATLTVRVPLVLECGSNYTVQLGAPWDFVVPTASGNNVNVVVVGTVTNQGLCGSYTATRTWQASDQFNDQLQCSQTVSVVAGAGPVVQCGTNKTVVAGSSLLFDTPMLSEPGVVAAAVYDNLGTDTGVRVNAGQVETGQQVVLGGTNRYVSGFEAGYWGTNASGPQFAGNVQAEVRFYRNDGPVLTGGEVSPGTVIYDSGPIGVGATNSGVLGIVDFVNGAAVPLSGVLPDTFTWTVQFSGLGAGDGAGLEVYGPVGVGVGGTNYWENVSGGWEALSNGGDLGVRVEAMSRGLSVVVVGTVTNQVTGVDYAVTRSWLGSDTCGNSAGCSQRISVISGPGLVSQPVDEVVTNGGATQFGVVASGTAPLSYQWWYNGSNSVAGGTNATLVLSNVTPGQAGGYEVVVSNLVGAITSQVATLTVRVPLVLECGSNYTVQLGTAWDFVVPTASGNKVGVVVVGTVTNQGLCGSYTATRTWQASDQFNDQLQCSQTVTVVGVSGLVVQCRGNRTVVAGSSLLFDTPVLSEPGVVAAVVYDNLGTDTSVRFNAGQVETGQQVVLGGTNRYASGFEVGYWGTNASGPQFAGNVQAEVRFYRNDGPVLTGGEVSPGTVIYDSGPIGVGATNSGVLGIVDFVNGAVVPLSGVLPDTFTWTVQFSGLGAGDGAGLEVYGPVGVGVGGTNYWENVSGGWEALSNGGDLGVRVEAMSHGLSVVVVGTVTNQVAGVDYAVTRSWLGSDTCGNSAGCSQRISVISGPGLVSQPVDEVVANGGVAQFGVVASGTAPLSYKWWYNGSNSVAGGTNATLVLGNVTPGQAGGYEVVVSNLVGAITSQVATLTVRVAAPSIIQQPKGLTVPTGQTATFTISAIGAPVPSYQWFYNDSQLLVGATNSSLTLTNVQIGQSGNYSVLVSNTLGSVLSTHAMLTVGDPPQISSQPASLVVTQGSQATFTVVASGTPPLRFNWYLNATNLLVGQTQPTLMFTNVVRLQSGQYAVSVSNAFGTTTSVPATLRVLVVPQITSFAYASNAVLLSFQTYPNLLYSIYFNTNLLDGNWIPLAKAIKRPGTGNIETVKDSGATNDVRFYRVLAE